MSLHARAGLCVLASLVADTEGMVPCPGESRGTHQCSFSDAEGYEYRVCQRVVDYSGQPLAISNGQSWWSLSDQGSREADMTAKILASGGDSWCTCSTCTSELIAKVGCEAVQIRCDATDTGYIFASKDPKYSALQ